MTLRNPNLYVLTGGPSTGKTTIINELQVAGYPTVNEVARQIIKDQVSKHMDALPWKDKAQYAQLMLEQSIASYEAIDQRSNQQPTFFDRGILDSIAYMRMENIPISEAINATVKKYRYHEKVFIFPPWNRIYTTDKERKQTWKEAEATYYYLKETYQDFGYHPIDMPLVPISQRIAFLLETIQEQRH